MNKNEIQIPQKKQTYWFIASHSEHCKFSVQESIWTNSTFGALRLAKGNVYLTQKEAETVCDSLNTRVCEITCILSARQRKDQIIKDAEARKAREEKAARKRLTSTEKARQYENQKQKKNR